MKGFIKVHEDGWNFVNAETGEIFVPYGANYFDPETGWAPKLWRMFDKNRVVEHFQKMANVGVNVARIFMTTASFQPQADVISNDGLEKLDTMIEVANKHGIRLILTGPDHWFKGGQVKYSLDITSNLLSHVRKNITISMMRI